MKSLRPKWKVLLAWTLFFYIILLGIVLKYQFNREMSRKAWTPPAVPTANPEAARPASQPDPSAEGVSSAELGQLLRGAAESWMQESPEKREQALVHRIQEFSALDSETVEGVVNHLLQNSGVKPPETRTVEISEINLNTAVPLNMRTGVDAAGAAGVWVTIQDDAGLSSEYWVAEADISPEEQQALRAFGMMNQVPGLEKLRPLLAPLLRQALQP
jgi:hypothetical protein